MEDVYKSNVHLSQGLNLRQLMETNATEFSIDLDFKKHKPTIFSCDADINPLSDLDDNDSDSDDDDTLKILEQSAEKKLLSSPEYLSFEELATKMVDCDPNGDVKMLIIEEGDGPLVPPDAEVTLHYAAYYERSKIPFDSTLYMNRGEPLRIRLGERMMLTGLEIGLTHIKGPTARLHLLLQPVVAYGPRGILCRIHPEPVLFVICLYDVRCVDAGSRFNDLPLAEQAKFETTMKTVNDVRAEAKQYFNRQKYFKAIRCYTQALNVLTLSSPENEKEEKEVKDLKVKVYVNLAVCYYKINKPKYVIGMCEIIDHIVDLNKHCKAIFYYGRAYELLGKTDKAISCYKQALKLEPKNIEIGEILAQIDEKNKKSKINEKVMWRKALSNEPEAAEKKLDYNVDDNFKNCVADMCQDLAARSDFAKFDLPSGVTHDEILCIKDLTSAFKCLEVIEDGDGKRKRVSVVKKVVYK